MKRPRDSDTMKASWGRDEKGFWVSEDLRKELEHTPQMGFIISSDDVGPGKRFESYTEAADFVVDFVLDKVGRTEEEKK